MLIRMLKRLKRTLTLRKMKTMMKMGTRMRMRMRMRKTLMMMKRQKGTQLRLIGTWMEKAL